MQQALFLSKTVLQKIDDSKHRIGELQAELEELQTTSEEIEAEIKSKEEQLVRSYGCVCLDLST